MEIRFWEGFFKAIESEFKNISEIKGASGITHKILCLGIDEKQKRLIVAQNEQDARILAMVQADLQARIKDYNVLMVRPVPVNLSAAFSAIPFLLGSSIITRQQLDLFAKKDEDAEKAVEKNKDKIHDLLNLLSPQVEIIQKTKLNLVPIFKELVQQLSHIKFLNELNSENFQIDFGEIVSFNPVVYDTALGVCPIPLYEFSVEETDSFINQHEDENKSILKKHSIYQFFYPPADALALGFIEAGNYRPEDITKNLSKVPEFGHPFGTNELADVKHVNEIVDALKDKGLAVEGEFNLELTHAGVTKRMAVKFTPRESIFKRLSNLFSIKVDINLRDFFGPK